MSVRSNSYIVKMCLLFLRLKVFKLVFKIIHLLLWLLEVEQLTVELNIKLDHI